MVNGNNNLLPMYFKMVSFLLLSLLAAPYSEAQEPESNYYYRVFFRDKGDYRISEFVPSDLLSNRAISRREKAGLPFPDYHDIPVYKKYLDEISSLGFSLHCTSKWMNSALFTTDLQADTRPLLSLEYVREVKIVKSPAQTGKGQDKLDLTTSAYDSRAYDNPVAQVKGSAIHQSGFSGKGILIAVLDGGFSNTENVSSLNDLLRRKGIKNTYDFVRKKSNVYDYHTHGTAVLSVLAGSIEGSIEGSAPGADYLLFRTEDTGSESSAEEDFWIAAAENADSSGADIITSSLGYFTFDGPSMNYEYQDIDGNSAFITKGADIAASKGILVVNSAGNEKGNIWNHIIAPSDGDSVLAVGAVDGSGMISSFSSPGPSFDGRIKPDVVAQGVGVPVQTRDEIVERSSGTSFSCPVVSGIAACIMEAVPDATAAEIISAIKKSSDRFNYPDADYGYGIPDMVQVLNELQKKHIRNPSAGSVAGPNPFHDHLSFYFSENPGWLRIEIFNISGGAVYKNYFREFISRSLILDDINYLSEGFYFVRIHTSRGSFVYKVVKTGNDHE